MPTWVMWVVCAGLLGVRGLLAGAEAALQGISDLRARELRAINETRGARLVRLKTEREASAAALRFAMVLCGFTAAAIATLVPPRLLDVSLGRLTDSPWMTWITPISSALLVAVMASVVDVSFRAWAVYKTEAWALALSGLMALTVRMLYPPMRLLIAALNLIAGPLGAKVSFQAPAPPLEELEKLLAERATKDKLDKSAPQLIRSIFELSTKTCRDVMVPRTDVIAVELNTPPNEILRLLAEESHSRMPVYKEDVDHIVGILHVRDLVAMVQNPDLIMLGDSLRPVAFVPWVKPIGDLLREMQRQKIHMAVVVDEYGGFMGIVTLEDILREIVGDIGDEFEEEERLVDRQSDGSWLVDAMLSPKDFARAFDFALPDGEYETLGGYLSHLAGAIPEVGDKFPVQGWTFQVHSKDGPRMLRIKVLKPRPNPSERRDSDPMMPAIVRPNS